MVLFLLRDSDTRGPLRNARNRQTPQWVNFIEIPGLFQLHERVISGPESGFAGGREAGFGANLCVCHGIGERVGQAGSGDLPGGEKRVFRAGTVQIARLIAFS